MASRSRASRSIAKEQSLRHFSSKDHLVLADPIQPKMPRLLKALEGHAPQSFDRSHFVIEQPLPY